MSGTIGEVLGPVTYIVETDEGHKRKRHADQIKHWLHSTPPRVSPMLLQRPLVLPTLILSLPWILTRVFLTIMILKHLTSQPKELESLLRNRKLLKSNHVRLPFPLLELSHVNTQRMEITLLRIKPEYRWH